MSHNGSAPTTAQQKWRILVVLASTILIAAACGSDATEPAVEADPTDEAGPEPDAPQSDASRGDLVGTWQLTDSDVTWEITDDVITSTFGGGIETDYTATAATIEMTDVSGERACPPNQVGTYEWRIADNELTVNLISDACGGRGSVLDGSTLTRQETGPEASTEDLLGTWKVSGGPTWDIEADRIIVTGGAATAFSYVVTGTTIELTDDTGCGTGTYEWEIAEDTLTLTVVADPCEGRRDAFNSWMWKRVG